MTILKRDVLNQAVALFIAQLPRKTNREYSISDLLSDYNLQQGLDRVFDSLQHFYTSKGILLVDTITETL